eukprot:gnl/TRDRNA2_/TRDRNA2_203684_c0_seq1.p1 gnl/TRDRNA2_/TRDRNA2_203684_c0~~gnl/TRDRNA2_/TRDRNA2_203684_c0_seq1.p1  ORF type:complete len:223 (-),score=22.44 gnl/TRDRNA2_/TRDRNA2_203684_c0_seq1:8-676(-)
MRVLAFLAMIFEAWWLVCGQSCYSLDMKYHEPCSKIAAERDCKEQLACMWGFPKHCVARKNMEASHGVCASFLSEKTCLAQMECDWANILSLSASRVTESGEERERGSSEPQTPYLEKLVFFLLLGLSVPICSLIVTAACAQHHCCLVCGLFYYMWVFGIGGTVVMGIMAGVGCSDFSCFIVVIVLGACSSVSLRAFLKSPAEIEFMGNPEWRFKIDGNKVL